VTLSAASNRGRHPLSSRDDDLDGQSHMQVGTIKDADGNDLPVWADMAGCVTRTFRDIDDWRSRLSTSRC
jgi:hypothetical protein